MKIRICFIVFIFFSQPSYTQILQDIIPDDLNSQGEGIKCFCQPGLENTSRSRGLTLRYGWINNSEFQDNKLLAGDSPTEIDKLRLLSLDVKIPLFIRDDLKVLAVYEYSTEKYELGSISETNREIFSFLDNELLRGNDYGLIVSKSFNEDSYAVAYLKYTAKGNYDTWTSFDPDYAIYKARLFYGKKPNDTFEWGLGLNFTSSFRRTIAIPFVVINKNWNNKWGFESVLPAFANVRYNLNPRTIFLSGFQVAGSTFRMKIPNENTTLPQYDFSVNHSELRWTLRVERRIVPWVWVGAQTGYQYNLNTQFEAKNTISPEFDVQPRNSPYFSVSLFISPPDDFGKDKD